MTKPIIKAAGIVAGGIVGTAFMTLYSYWRSRKHEKQFVEPELLAGLVKKGIDNKKLREEIGSPEGWALHIGAGMSFIASYTLAWENSRLKPNVFSGLLLGALNGIVAVGIWQAAFQLHPNPPKTDYEHFYRQLLVAHLVFGVTGAVTYQAVESIAGKSDIAK